MVNTLIRAVCQSAAVVRCCCAALPTRQLISLVRLSQLLSIRPSSSPATLLGCLSVIAAEMQYTFGLLQ